MITVYCAACGRKLFRYQKIGKGRLLHHWHSRISSDYTIRRGNDVYLNVASIMVLLRKRNGYSRWFVSTGVQH